MPVKRKPWERRLEDLAHLLRGCGAAYFDPDLFRRNTNQFLQTARTVTFLIQKEKASIPDFDNWYQKHAIEPWGRDEVMRWAKDARNIIEKEGDLELHSTLDVSLIVSYLEEDDIKIECGRSELLHAGIKRLVRYAQKKLPTGISDAAGIRVERSWKTSGLKSHELLYALGYVYSRLFECSHALAQHIGSSLSESIPEPTEVSELNERARHLELIKLRDMHSYRIKHERKYKLPEDELPSGFREKVEGLKDSLGKPSGFDSTVNFYSQMAEITFEEWGNHINMVFLFNGDWSVQQFITPFLADQTDKYFFWRMISERIKIQKTYCLIHVAEIWIRDLSKRHLGKAIRELPIIGESLQFTAIDQSSNQLVITWPIERAGLDQPPRLGERREEKKFNNLFFLVPVMRGMGLQPDFLLGD